MWLRFGYIFLLFWRFMLSKCASRVTRSWRFILRKLAKSRTDFVWISLLSYYTIRIVHELTIVHVLVQGSDTSRQIVFFWPGTYTSSQMVYFEPGWYSFSHDRIFDMIVYLSAQSNKLKLFLVWLYGVSNMTFDYEFFKCNDTFQLQC